jgi:ribosome biogenesis SPOUT family RNA methylase Rps3
MVKIVIEHLDEELFEWSVCEYSHMVEFLTGTDLSLEIYNLGPLVAQAEQ